MEKIIKSKSRDGVNKMTYLPPSLIKPKFLSWDSHDIWREPIFISCPLTSTCTLMLTSTHI